MMAKQKKIYKEIVELIESSKKILVASHQAPDGDSIASVLGMRNYIDNLGKKVTATGDGSVPYKYMFLPGTSHILDYKKIKGGRDYDLVIIVDCSNFERADYLKSVIDPDVKIINIDHHPDNNRFGAVNLVLPEVSSVSEILTDMFLEIGWDFDQDTATALYAGILTDSGRFRFESTGRQTMELAGILLDQGVNARDICDRIYYSMPPSVLTFTGMVLSKMKFYDNNRISIIELDQKMLDDNHITLGDLEGLAEYTLYSEDALVGGFLKEISEKCTRISLRSRRGIDVSTLAQKNGGGGHVNASGYSLEMPISKCREVVVNELKELLNG
jgi:phosphoesterase RecJ-like protein